MNKEEIIKPLNLEETALMDRLKESYFIDSVHYKDEDSEKYFKLLCHLEDFVIQYHELLKENKKLKKELNKKKVILKELSKAEKEQIINIAIERFERAIFGDLENYKGDNIE